MKEKKRFKIWSIPCCSYFRIYKHNKSRWIL